MVFGKNIWKSKKTKIICCFFYKNVWKYRKNKIICMVFVKNIWKSKKNLSNICLFKQKKYDKLNKHKMDRFTLTRRGVAVGLIQAGVSKQKLGLHFPLFLANY